MASHFHLFGFVLARSFFSPSFRLWIPNTVQTVQTSALCRSRRELSNEYLVLLAEFRFDTAEKEPCKVCPLSAYRSLIIIITDHSGPSAPRNCGMLCHRRTTRNAGGHQSRYSGRSRNTMAERIAVSRRIMASTARRDGPPSAHHRQEHLQVAEFRG